MNLNLPPLPEPVAWTLASTLDDRETTTRAYLWFTNPVNCSWAPLYTAEQVEAILREAVREAVEACARVCEEQAKEPECPERAAYCAAAIRALLSPAVQEGKAS